MAQHSPHPQVAHATHRDPKARPPQKGRLKRRIFMLLSSLSIALAPVTAMAACHCPSAAELEQIRADMQHVELGADGEPTEEGYRLMGIESGGSHCSKNPDACKPGADGDAG